MHRLLLNVTQCVCNSHVLSVILSAEQLDTATKQRAAECSDQRQHVFVKLLEQSESFIRETVLS